MRRLLIIPAILLLAACAGRQSAERDDLTVALPEWLALESDYHCYPVDESQFNNQQHEVHFPLSPDDDIWPRLQAGLMLEYVDHPSVNAQRDWYLKNPQYLQRVQERANRYLFHILEMLHEHDVPYDIALMPIVESAYQAFAYSHGQAAGLWQFIPMSGRRFGLQQNWWKDDRRDVVESTRAAIAYLNYLHGFFDGDWLLAFAAYNAGEGTVRNAIRRNARRGQPTDFWHLDLPRETRAYVPKIIALSDIFRNAAQYDIPLLPISNQPYFTSVRLDSQLDLLQAAELAGISIEELYFLNPGLNRWATPPGEDYALKIPVHNAMDFTANLAALPREQRITWQRHTIRQGESLISIARQYRTDKSWIKQVNSLNSDVIIAGKVLMVPVASANHESYRLSQSQRLDKRQSRKPGANRQRIDHTVQAGDSFWQIARRYDVDINALARWNNKSPRDILRPGEKLVVWARHSQQTFNRQAREEKIARINYRVRNGDSLAKIAGKFNVGIGEIVNWNKINPDKYLQPGQALTLYVNVMNTSH